MSRYGKLILIIGVVVACAVGAILPFAFASSAERDEDANALRDVGRLVQTQGGVISNYSIAIWTDSLDMTLTIRGCHFGLPGVQRTQNTATPPVDRSGLPGQWSQSR
jgi:hypothetical protein